MKTNKLMILVVAVLMLGVLAPTAKAELGWYTCKVTMAGLASPYVYIQFSEVNGLFEEQWAVAADVVDGNRMLAVCLAAMQGNNDVKVWFNSDEKYPILRAMYVMPAGTL